MQILTSKDGTKIAFEQHGDGPALIIVQGALSDHNAASMPQLIELLAQSFTVYNYDRRGKGDSGDTQPYAVDREIEDISALIDEAGGKAHLFGHSSGAALILLATTKLDDKVKKIALYEAPYNDDPTAQHKWKQYIKGLTELLVANRRGDAIALFMQYMGMPIEQVEGMRHSPFWPVMEAMAPTLAYDHKAILGETAAIPAKLATGVTVPVLVMNGSASFPFMHQTAETLSKLMPHAQLRVLEGQTHEVEPSLLAAVLTEFFAQKG